MFAGLANSFLTGNVYMAECAPSRLVLSFKQIEVRKEEKDENLIFLCSTQAACRSIGAVLIFIFYIVFKQFGFQYVVIVGGLFPSLAFFGTLRLRESPIFGQR